MSISLDNAPSTRGLASSASSIAFTLSRTAGNGIIYAMIGSVGSADCTSVDYGVTDALTKVGSVQNGATRWQLWRCTNPANSGTKDIRAFFAASQSTIVINGVALTVTSPAAQGNATTNQADSVTALGITLTLSSGSWMVLCGGSNVADLTAGTGTTCNSTSNPISGWNSSGAGGSTTMNVNDASSDSIALIADEAAETGGATGQPTMRRWGGVESLGGQGIGNKGPGRGWG